MTSNIDACTGSVQACYPFYACTKGVQVIEGVVMARPTWNGEPVADDDLVSVLRESFELLIAAMREEAPVSELSVPELLHLVEASSHLDRMSAWAETVAVPRAREAGASWAMLATAMGVRRSTAQSRYKKATQDTSRFVGTSVRTGMGDR
jgi:hypothetical protein